MRGIRWFCGAPIEMTGIRIVAKGGICMSIFKYAGQEILSKQLIIVWSYLDGFYSRGALEAI